MVDMDEEKGRPSTGRNVHRVQVRLSKTLDLFPLEAYLSGQAPFDNIVLEAITFIDHLLRVFPSENLLSIKRSFFDKSMAGSFPLSGGVIAMKGVYQSLRPVQGGGLVINADVAHTCFWDPEPSLVALANGLLPATDPRLWCNLLWERRQPRADGPWFETPEARQLRRLKRLRFNVWYDGITESAKSKIYIVEEILHTNALETTFKQVNHTTGESRDICLRDYFNEQYGTHIHFPGYPTIKTSRGQLFPIELCFANHGERYNFKANELQTSQMIKYAVTKPDVRAQAIYNGLKALDWKGDPYLKQYKMDIADRMITTNARLLVPPEVEFGKGKTEKPGTSGRWRIDGKQFIEPAGALKHWGVMVLDNFGRGKAVATPAVQQFIVNFIGEYQKFGGTVTNRQPIIMPGRPDIAKAVEALWESVARKCTPPERPQILLFIVNAKSTDPYNRLKKNCDCRYGVVSQVMQAAHVQKNQGQYIGNVLMKVNAKLGGFSFRSLSYGVKPNTQFSHFKQPTMIIGADVSHPGPGSLGASMAAVTVSMDKFGAKYVATCQSNGSRIEMISTWNFEDMLRNTFIDWIKKFHCFPKHIIYMRDGVSEGQFQHVLHQEIRDLKAVWDNLDLKRQGWAEKIKFTVIVASKRHHIRFFPKAPNRDNNNNPLPGTLVERDVTSPYGWDFYLCAHRAIQGTARPVHYTVLMDENKSNPDWLVKMIYEHSYQYVRSSTPVSVHPAIYYAHLAARRAVAHEKNQGMGDGPRSSEIIEREDLIEAKIIADRTGKILRQDALQRLKALTELEHPRLIPMNNEGEIKETMWYV